LKKQAAEECDNMLALLELRVNLKTNKMTPPAHQVFVTKQNKPTQSAEKSRKNMWEQ
jgi:hypothetical protein